MLIVDGLIKYLFDPSAPPGEGLISAGPPLESNAGIFSPLESVVLALKICYVPGRADMKLPRRR